MDAIGELIPICSVTNEILALRYVGCLAALMLRLLTELRWRNVTVP